MLGPIEVARDEEGINLGGTKQRATLGYLLLHANRVVATSQLLNALWSVDEAPTTARKILQNAVYGLRGALTSHRDTRISQSPMLLTQPPGYMMRVDPEQVDLYLFHKWVEVAREKQAQGDARSAADLLSDALGLWRGPALADLAEAGMEWPELATIQNARLDATEDYFEAQLACGRHHAVLADLEAMVAAEPLRERACNQLMLALYRCGRQADALTAYSQVRAELVENLGLEPGRDLQRLQQSILTQDPGLSHDRSDPRGPVLGGPEAAAAPGPADEAVRTLTASATGDAPGPQTPPVGSDRRRVSVVAVRTRLVLADGDRPQDLDDLLDGAAQLVREQIERAGGTVTASLGSVTLAVFGLHEPGGDDDRQAVLAALAVRDALDATAPRTADGVSLNVHASVNKGEVLLRRRTKHGAPIVVGATLDESQSLLSEVPAGEVRVSEAVRAVTDDAVFYVSTDKSPHLWQAVDVRERHAASGGRASGRAYELDVLQGLLKRTWHCSVPHLVTVLGESGMGKSELLEDFGLWVADQRDAPMVLTACPSSAPADHPLKVLAQILSDHCGIHPADTAADAQDALARTVREVIRPGVRADWMVSRLGPLLSTVTQPAPDVTFGSYRTGEMLNAWSELFQHAARDRALVLCMDDLHRVGDGVLRVIEDLAESTGPRPLFVVVAAAPELLLRRPTWAGGKSRTTTVTLDRPARTTGEQLMDLLLSAARSDGDQQFCG
ncbi:AAA family ATPase [Streptomyces sp. ISL-112]|nr:AAA family ATPase [Streptomyces sp. ISL-112]